MTHSCTALKDPFIAIMLLVVAGNALGRRRACGHWIIESANPKVAGMDGAVRSHVEFFGVF